MCLFVVSFGEITVEPPTINTFRHASSRLLPIKCKNVVKHEAFVEAGPSEVTLLSCRLFVMRVCGPVISDVDTANLDN